MNEIEPITPADEKKFQIQQLYVKHQRFDAPNIPTVFNKDNWDPKMHFEIQANPRSIKGNLYEVVLQVKIKADSGEQRAFDCEIQQAALFEVEGFSEDEQKFLLSGACPNVLYPYARKVITDLVIAGGFPPVTLAPMNFEAIYMQEHQKQMNAKLDPPKIVATH